jgi:hypothetical protein
VTTILLYFHPMHVTSATVKVVTLFVVKEFILLPCKHLMLFRVMVVIGLFDAYRMCWVSRRVKRGTSVGCIRKTVAHLVLQMPYMRLSSAWRIHGEVSIHLAALIF